MENYEFLEVVATVDNRTEWPMEIATSHLEWGKFDEGKSPVNVHANSKSVFVARGRSASPSGTEGYAVWTMPTLPGGAEIKATFGNPYKGDPSASISSSNGQIEALAKTEKNGHSYSIEYVIQKRP